MSADRRVRGSNRILAGTLAAGAIAAAVSIALAVRPAQPEALPAVHVSAPPLQASVRWTPEQVVEGTIFAVIVEGSDAHEATGSFGDQPLHFAPRDEGGLVALAGAPLEKSGAQTLIVEVKAPDGRSETESVEIDVAAGSYPMETLRVAPQFGREQPPEIKARIDEEAARAREAARASHSTPRMWSAPFVAPRESRVTSAFGGGRTFNGQVQSRHTGTDFAGAVGAPVVAPARGRVVIVDAFYLGGNVIYIDHGAGLMTAYLHLSEQLVSEGDVVEAGQTIGKVGATGRVTGPHLHWIVRYGENSLDGRSLLALQL